MGFEIKKHEGGYTIMRINKRTKIFFGSAGILLTLATLFFNGLIIQATVSGKETVHVDNQLYKQTEKREPVMIEKISSMENPTVVAALEDAEKFGVDIWFSGEYSYGNYDDTHSLLSMSGSYLHGEIYIDDTGEKLNTDTDPDAAKLGDIREAVRKYAEQRGIKIKLDQ
ncbi:hypothetical protein [Enterococcus sp. AZ192]|uniref:hypothetical protein n=2 Tax=unclassified Enterococcus TaxID=2608891 RepID=UPI003D29B17E